MRPEIVVRLLVKSLICLGILYFVNGRHDHPEELLSIATVALFAAAAIMILRSRMGKLPTPLIPQETLRLAAPATVLWLGVGLGDVIASPHSLYVLVAPLVWVVVYSVADAAFMALRGKA